MLRTLCTTTSLVLLVQFISVSHADLVPGLISNFQDGTVQGWGGGTVSNVANVGPLGVGDHSLQLSNGVSGSVPRFAMFNTGVNGVISPSVNSISADIFRSTGGSGEIRLVLFDIDATRWTTTTAANVIDDGVWRRYSFSVNEADLTRVSGSSSYASLTANLERIMFRHDPSTPSAGGAALNGTMNFDNITAVPEPSSMLLLANLLVAGCILRRRR